MGVVIPQIITEDKADSAQSIDGSLRFDASKSHYLTRTPSSVGSRTIWTWSGWIKTTSVSIDPSLFTVNGSDDNTLFSLVMSGRKLYVAGSATGWLLTTQIFRDPSAWYHIVLATDTTQSTASNRFKLYVNGTRVTAFSTENYPTQNQLLGVNNTNKHHIGAYFNTSPDLNGLVTNVYLIDGQQLDPSYFGYTDPLTNTWRPKKLSSSIAFGTNGFYLPLDGNTPIGQDRSGNNNNWTPVNFGGSNTLEKATGALPILNTDGGGKVARVGVRTDSNASSLVLALPLVGIKSDFSNAINSGTTEKAITATNATATSSFSNFYGGSFDFSGTASTKQLSFSGGSDLTFGTGDFTIEAWVYMISRTTNYNQYVFDSTGRVAFFQGLSYGYEQITFYDTANNYTTTSAVVQYGKWQHWAVTRQSGTIKIFLDGVSQTLNSTSSTTNIGAQTTGYIGCYFGGGGVYNTNGYIQDFRIYKGLAKYTQNFIPASTDPDILPDTPSGVAYSSNVALVPSTDGAVAFDGSGDYLTAGSSADYDPGSGNFTVEFFLYSPSIPSGNQRIVQYYYQASPFYGWTIDLDTSNRIAWFADGFTQIYTPAITSGKWTHIAWVKNGSSNIIYVDGVNSGSYTQSTINSPGGAQGGILAIGALAGASYSQYFNGFISNLHIVKGTALYTSNFTPPTAPITSVANTKLLCCKSNTSATAADVTPGTITANGNAAATNFNPFTVNINTQRGQESGYCTLNPLARSTSSQLSFSNGNLDVKIDTGSFVWSTVPGTIAVNSGKWYFEATLINLGGSEDVAIGLVRSDMNLQGYFLPGDANQFAYAYFDDGRTRFSSTNLGQPVSYGASYTNGDTIGVSYDADSGTLVFYKNGISQGTAFSSISTSIPWMPFVSGGNTNNNSWSANFGQKPFKFPPPAGFQPLALANTPRPTIVRPDQFVGVTTYTGTSAAKSINIGWKPDLVWIKSRTQPSGNGFYHHLTDTVRGATKWLTSNATDTEYTGGVLTSFDSYGFSLDYTTVGHSNQLGDTYVAWCWKAGGNSNTFNINDVGYATASAAGLTGGTINPTGASVNTKSGFSIVGWTGTGASGSIPHGLGRTPSLVIVKNRSSAVDWHVYHSSVGTSGTSYLVLNSTAGIATDANRFTASPSSTVISVGSSSITNGSTNNMIAYSWAEISGFSKFGTYTGNNSNDGPNIFLGFRPRVILVKRTDTTQNWFIFDSARSPVNLVDEELFPNLTNIEGTGNNDIDFLSNGFKIRFSGTAGINQAGTYIYAAFAETPTFNLYGGQANAR